MFDILDTLDDVDDDDLDLEDDATPESTSIEIFQPPELLEGEELSPARAQEVTQAIRAAATATFVLLAFAHKHQAHKAMGYDTWAEYVRGEFDMSAQRSYQLLDLGKIVHELEEVSPEGTEVKLTEAQARDIKRELPFVTEKVKEATQDKSPEEAAEEIDRIVEDIRDQKKADDKAAGDKSAADDAAREAAEQDELSSAADALLEADSGGELSSSADDEFMELTVEGDGKELSPDDSMNLYNFFNVLSGLGSLPEPDDFVKIVPPSRAKEIETQLLEAVSWLNRFQTLWELELEG